MNTPTLRLRSYSCALVLLATFAAASARAQDQQPAPLNLTGHTILVKKIVSSEVKLPAAFQYAIYEYTLQELKKSGRFQTIYREGDSAAAGVADLLTLETDATGFKEGSARARQVTTVAGATTIKVHMKLIDKDGKVVLERDVQGKVRFFGENLRATYALAKSIAKVIKYNFVAPKPAKT
ncbi:MAG: hypothetical protein ABSG16_20005 [Candidatus Acidiferrum sp.]